MAKKKKRGTNAKSKKKNTTTKPTTWVDNLEWQSVKEKEASTDSNSLSISIVSWNVLAQSYLTKRSHRGLPREYQSRVFVPKQRKELVCKTIQRLARLNLDIMCLQEVDMSEVHSQLSELNFDGVSTPTNRGGGGGGGRVDACSIYWNKQKYKLIRHEVVRLDDLAYNTTTSVSKTGKNDESKDNTNGNRGKNGKSKESPLQGLQQSFLRRNAAILVELQCISTNTIIVVANAHLYWHPGYEYVKLCQCHYVLQRLTKFNSVQCPTLFCGDLNSRPKSIVHEYLTEGLVNAKRVAPWYRYNDSPPILTGAELVARDECEDVVVPIKDETQADSENNAVETHNDSDTNSEAAPANGEDDAGGISNMLQESCRLADNNVSTAENDGTPCIRYLLDFTLNRFTRWLRILGIDAALETDVEEEKRTKHSDFIIFERCKQERRTLLTTSSKMMLRKDCPPGTYLVDPRNLEFSLVHLCLSHGIVLKPRDFLSRCVVCNGSILEVFDMAEKKRIFADHQAPDMSMELNVYRCDGCGQGYWWCDKPGSSASRVKEQATKLFEMCLRGGVPITGDLHMFDFVNVEQEREKGSLDLEKDENSMLEVVEWLRNKHLSYSLPLKSAYAGEDELPFTNVTHDFVGALDYIFFDSDKFSQTHRLYVPRTFEELNGAHIPNGHLLPSNVWPSDHLAIGTRLVLSLLNGESVRHQKMGSSAFADKAVSNTVKEKGAMTAAPGESRNASTTNEIINGMESMKLDGNIEAESDPNSEATAVPASDLNKESRAHAFVPVCGTVGEPMPPPSMSVPSAHGQRCTCGCVPNVLSLFEMAELRKQARLKSQKERKYTSE